MSTPLLIGAGLAALLAAGWALMRISYQRGAAAREIEIHDYLEKQSDAFQKATAGPIPAGDDLIDRLP